MSGFGTVPLGSGTFGSMGSLGPPPILADSSSSAAWTTTPSVTDIRQSVADAFAITGVPIGIDLPNLIEALNASASISVARTSFPNAADTATFSEALAIAWALVLQEDITLADVSVGNPLLLAAIREALVATGTVSSQMDAIVALAAAIAFEDLFQHGWSAELVDSPEFADALEQSMRAVAEAIDAALASAVPEGTMQLLAVVSESVEASTSVSALAQLHAEGSDSVMLYGNFRIGGQEISGWVINTTNKAASQYTNQPFESLVFWQGRSLAAGAGGIFEHTGDTDDGANIPAYIRTGLMDFGTGKLKNVPDVWIGFKGDGRLVLKVVTTNATGTKVEDWYISNADTRGTELREGRFQLGRGIESRYWGWTIHNVAGGDLDLSEVAMRPVILSRRR